MRVPTLDAEVYCPWCRGAVTETWNGDGQLLGWACVRRNYRCAPCGLTINVIGDPEVAS